jgi:hypothetical protein
MHVYLTIAPQHHHRSLYVIRSDLISPFWTLRHEESQSASAKSYNHNCKPRRIPTQQPRRNRPARQCRACPARHNTALFPCGHVFQPYKCPAQMKHASPVPAVSTANIGPALACRSPFAETCAQTAGRVCMTFVLRDSGPLACLQRMRRNSNPNVQQACERARARAPCLCDTSKVWSQIGACPT